MALDCASWLWFKAHFSSALRAGILVGFSYRKMISRWLNRNENAMRRSRSVFKILFRSVAANFCIRSSMSSPHTARLLQRNTAPAPLATASLPLVYACSGCSGAAQMANDLAVRLDRHGYARMSCVAGLGGDVPAILQLARCACRIVVLDGCRLHCARRCVERHGIAIDDHVDLSAEGILKRMGENAPAEELETIWRQVILPRVTSVAAIPP